MNPITYPYIPLGRIYKYASGDNPFMEEAREYAKKHSKDKNMPNASVLVKGGKVIGRGANGSTYHDTHECERVKLKIPTGQGYELCEGCHSKNHSEPKVIADAQTRGEDTRGADVYLWGHWWCCEPCWHAMIKAGIKDVYLLEGSEKLFNKNHSDNVIGRQFEV